MRTSRSIALALGVAGISGIVLARRAAKRWDDDTSEFEHSLRVDPDLHPRPVDFATLASLPAPVVRYFHATLQDGQRRVTGARATQSGDFLVGTNGGWHHFEATQSFRADRPGFVWDARIEMLPLVDVCVRDAYVGGHAAMRASILAMFDLVNERARAELDEGALQRYLAEAVWFPTALLPSNELTWAAVDESHATATLRCGQTHASVTFEFAPSGEIVAVRASRFRAQRSLYERAPWGGTYSEYADCEGMHVPRRAEVAWIVDGDTQPYDRVQLTAIDYVTSA